MAQDRVEVFGGVDTHKHVHVAAAMDAAALLLGTAVSDGSSGGSAQSCGLRTKGTITCWGSNRWGAVDAPSGQYTAVSAGGRHPCGLRTDGTITCWLRNIEINLPAH